MRLRSGWLGRSRRITAASALALATALAAPHLAAAQTGDSAVSTSTSSRPPSMPPILLATSDQPDDRSAAQSPAPPTPAEAVAPQGNGPTRTPATPAASTESAGPSTPLAGAVSTEATPAVAPPAAAGSAAGSPPPSELVAINLVRLLVKQGVITQQAANGLIAEARNEAAQARTAVAANELPAAPAGTIRVPYVPQIVRDQIKQELKTEVMAEAKSQGWAAPNLVPNWVDRITIGGDLRFRDAFDLYSKNNIAPYIDYATFNSSGPIDVNAGTNTHGFPYLDTRTDRDNLLSIRARLGFTAQVNDWVSVGLRLATGSNDGPVSTTQILGGGFSKKDIWLDQAFVKLSPADYINIVAGRMPNPFDSSLLLFSENLNFDGVAVSGQAPIRDTGLRVRGVGGVFPIGYVGADFPTQSGDKTGDRTSYLMAAQGGADWQPNPGGFILHGSLAYYDYSAVKGEASLPCAIYTGLTQCSSDDTAPPFMQKGNTLFLLRQIEPDPNNPTNFAQPQLVGLAYNYRLIDVRGGFELPLFGKTRALFEGEYVRNLAYDPGRVVSNPLTPLVTNFDVSPDGLSSSYHSGANGFRVSGWFGNLTPVDRGDWNLLFGYTYTEPDAVPDGFNDNDFHLGGTNAKGYFLLGNYFFARNAWLSSRYLAATAVFGPPLDIDVLFLDLNARF